MCSFVFSTLPTDKIDFNRIMRLRGPDVTREHSLRGYSFCHNLLSMRGNYVAQPYVAPDEDVVILFNGEIYNCPDDQESEARYLHDLYLEKGADIFRHLDGEYAILIVDFRTDTLLAARDCFGTKPLFFGSNGKDFGFASYRDALSALGFSDIQPLKPNHVVEYALDGSRIVSREIYQFNIAQHETEVEPWFDAFDAAVAKRVRHLRGTPFVGLSSGYDSGAIAASLIAQGTPFMSITVEGREDPQVVAGRIRAVEASGNRAITIPQEELDVARWQAWLKDHVEDEPYVIVNDEGERLERGKSVHGDKAALILAGVCDKAKQNGALVYLSGSGADEIFSDYGFQGRKFFAHSNFGGLYPQNLLGHFPWSSFYGSTQAAYLFKEEMVAGSFGMEARYPFLDLQVVQSFLSLTADVKNELYKSVIRRYLAHRDFPVHENAKIGFGFARKRPWWKF